MSIKQRIVEDMKSAMKAGRKNRLEVLRMVKARMMEAEVGLRADKGRDYELSDPEAIQVLSSYGKQRRDSIDSFRQSGREDLAVKEEAELAVIQEYLPRQLSAEEITRIAREAITSAGATSMKEFGTVMKLVMPQLKGTADGIGWLLFLHGRPGLVGEAHCRWRLVGRRGILAYRADAATCSSPPFRQKKSELRLQRVHSWPGQIRPEEIPRRREAGGERALPIPGRSAAAR